ncbi:MAG: MBOAT family protein [Proteobacteria bacterium]|nr:MBOAT family protein [Pseudomonadota bacterium]
MIEKNRMQKKKKFFLILSLTGNLGILGFFKYTNFLTETFVDSINFFGATLPSASLDIALPVGISFYTFQSLSYTLDVYFGNIKAEKSWLRFSFFVAFFPQLIAGPIVRAKDFLPQTWTKPSLSFNEAEEALFKIFKGLFKKVVLADVLAIYVDGIFSSPGNASTVSAWIGLYAFSFQIYFDFSGYSDIAIGCARLLGFHLPINFKRPYVASSITDFWRRWHISLSSWLRDYLYIPLGGNKMRRKSGIYKNIMLTMLIGGLWHGAAFNFIIWGGIQGLLLVFERATGIYKKAYTEFKLSPKILIRQFMTFNIITLLWLSFRSENIQSLATYLETMFTFGGQFKVTTADISVLGIIFFSWMLQYISEYSRAEAFLIRLPVPVKALSYAVISIVIFIVNGETPKPFVYFQF